MRVFITASFKESKDEIERLCQVVKSTGLEDFCFIRDVENYQKIFNDPKELMQRATEEIKKSDALLIDMTDKPTGRMIEVGIAYSLGKKIIVIMKRGTQIKDTTRGVADAIIEYDSIEDISNKLQNTIIK
ncbi:MAG: nucleoside 2-deoxyribosyltransferase [Candidatus Staskawiczbacteria bacterium]|nr:nucleoside 2-deoxyribosyltransferase [Candidatus Staskawiczbacteria bacterium]